MAVHNPLILLTNDDTFDPEIKKLRTHWREKEWDFTLAYKERLGAMEIKDDNMQWRFYLNILELLEQNKIPAVFFTPPRNFTLMNKITALEQEGYKENYTKLINAAQEKGIAVIRYDNWLDDEYFTDFIHPNVQGNKIMASKLVNDLIKAKYFEELK